MIAQAGWHTLGRVLRLLLPVLVPSWRFFDSIGPSPRIEYQAWRPDEPDEPDEPDDPAKPWTPWTLTPPRVGVAAQFARLFLNAERNETLFLLACCERLLDEGSAHAEHEIAARLAVHLGEAPAAMPGRARFRIALVYREAGQVQRQVAFVSAPFLVTADVPP